MEARVLRQGRHRRIGRVAPELRDAFLGLRRDLGVACARLRVLQLDDVAVTHVPVVDALRKEAEVVVTVRKLHLRLHEVVADVAELRLHVALDAELARDVAPDRRRRGEVLRETPEERLPFAAVGHAARELRPADPVGTLLPAVAFPEIAEELLLDAGVRDPEVRLPLATFRHREDAVVMEERAEVRRLDDRVRREALDELERHLPRRRELLRERIHVLHVLCARLPLELDDRLELVVVRRDVAVHHVLGRTPVEHHRLEVVEHHVAVEDAFPADLLPREAVAVVPRLDGPDDRLGLPIPILLDALEVAVDRERLLLGEPEHRIERLVLRDVRGDVEAARQIVHRHRRDARHEDAVEAALEQLEPIAVESGAMGDRPVRIFPGGTDEQIREVVVFVDDQIKRQPVRPGGVRDDLVFRVLLDGGERSGREEAGIAGNEIIQRRIHVIVELRLKRVAAHAADLGEVERQHKVLVAVLGRMLAKPEPSEELLEVRLLATVVVRLHHADEERLAEPPRSDEENERVTLLKLREKLRLVNVVPSLVADSLEIRNAIGDLQITPSFHIAHYTKN